MGENLRNLYASATWTVFPWVEISMARSQEAERSVFTANCVRYAGRVQDLQCGLTSLTSFERMPEVERCPVVLGSRFKRIWRTMKPKNGAAYLACLHGRMDVPFGYLF